MRRLILLLVVAALAGALYWKRDEAAGLASAHVPALAAYLGKPGPAAAPAARVAPSVPVVVARAERKTMPLTIEAVGTVQPVASIQIKPRLDSQIVSVSVQEGALVKEGDVLVQLDGRALRAQLAQAEALIAKDKAQIEQARRDLSRADELLGKRIGTEVQRDTAGTTVKTQEAQLAADTAQRDNVAALLSYTEMRSPVAGRIGSIALKAGTSVRSADAQAIMTVNQIDPIYVQFAVPQTLFAEMRTSFAAGAVAVEALVGAATVKGTLSFVENTVDLATGTVLARALMANTDERLWPGAFVSVRAMLGTQADAITVPAAAIQLGQQGPYLFVIRENRKAALTPVTIARTVGGEAVISAGLSGGEQVVVDGQLRLTDGATVQIQSSREGVATTRPPAAAETAGTARRS